MLGLSASLQVFLEAQELLPGGVNSPVRAFRSVGGGPIVFDRVKGAYAWDVDANKAGGRGRSGCRPPHLQLILAPPVHLCLCSTLTMLAAGALPLWATLMTK